MKALCDNCKREYENDGMEVEDFVDFKRFGELLCPECKMDKEE